MAIQGGDVVWNITGVTDEFKKALAQSKQMADNFGKTLMANSKVIGASMTAAGVGMAGLLGKAASIANEFDTAAKKLTVSLGEPIEQVKAFDKVITQVYGNNFGESIQDVADSVKAVALGLKTVGVVSKEEIGTSTEYAIALRDTFDADVTGSIDAVTALMQNFGLKSTEAFDFIAKGFQSGLDKSGDFLESVTEYSTQFANGGAEAEQFFSLLQSGLASGNLGTDKAADLFKEFRVRILDGSKATSDALMMLGINVDQFIADLSSGSMTTADAFQAVIEKLRETGDQSILMQAGVGLLGTQFEDLGESAVLGIDLSITKMSDLEGAIKSLNDQYNTLGNDMEGAKRKFELVGKTIGETVAPSLNDSADGAKSFAEWLIKFQESSPGVVDALVKIGIGIAGFLIVAGPIILFINELSTLFKNLGVTKAGVIAGFWKLVEVMKFINGVALKLIGAVFSPLGAAVAAVGIAIGAAAITISSEWDNIKKLFSDFAGWVYDWVSGIAGAIGDFASTMYDAFLTAFTSPIDAIKMAWGGLVDWYSGIFNWFIDTARSIAGLIAGTVGNLGVGPQAVGEFFGIGGTPGFSSGGTSAGGVIRVGESGPETMIVPPGTKIAPHDPNNAGAAGMAGVTLNVYSPTFLDDAQMDRFNTGIGRVISEQLRAAGSFA